ncbi:MAG: hypothetical protein K2I69_05360 [Muribaculaceae bacterium]|nr:hypothetical protein [Muribaculaceae bacterium]
MFNIFKKKPSTPAELCFNVDIHCHIVPGVDDGSPDAAHSADLIERMQRWGIKRIIASPHVTQYTFENSSETIEPAMQQLQSELSARGNAIPVGHSAEYRIDELFMERLEKNELMLLPDNFILIENSFMQEPWNLDQLVFDLQVRGFKPILAHPERYSYYNNKKERYGELHRAGLAFQINLLSLAGNYGKMERKIAEYLMSEGMVDFVGTDLHRTSHADAIDAYLLTQQARKDMDILSRTVRNNKVFL